MSEMSVGKNGMPVTISPVRIIRPGDPGFPVEAQVTGSKFANCQHPGCGIRFLPSVPGIRYCLNHNTPAAAHERDAGMVSTPHHQRPIPGRSTAVTKPKEPAKCPQEGCTNPRMPGKGLRYCTEHSTEEAVAERRRALYRKKAGPPKRKNHVAATIRTSLANLKAKETTSERRQPDGQKADAGKLPLDSILSDFPRALMAIAQVGAHGNATKYVPGSWLKLDNGVQRVRDAAFRHWVEARLGNTVDPHSGLLALAHEAWNKLAELELVLREQRT